MSKSFGNVISPDDIVEKYGSDALRLTLVSKVSTNFEDINIAEPDFIESRNKIESIWNLAHELINLINQYGTLAEAKDNDRCESEEDFEQLVQHVSFAIEGYHFKYAVDSIFSLGLQSVEDKLMLVKRLLQDDELDSNTIVRNIITTKNLLRRMLVILHPFIPFVTEELWERLNYGNGCILDTEWQPVALQDTK